MAAAASGEAAAEAGAAEASDIRLVITASSLGTVFEWYDFFIYGTLAASGIIGRVFFPTVSETMQTLLAWAGFAVGFGFRPLGAILFGYLGDRLGRKHTFLVTITLMGIATAGVGLIPSYAAIGMAAPLLVLLLRILQGLALGGEYGGAAIYVSEHAPAGRRGFYTGFIQSSVSGGFVLSLAVVLATKAALPAAAWGEWGWRFPFLFSLALLAVSLWMRLKLAESPVFQAMKAAGETARNPFVESFTYPGNLRRLFVALLGLAAGMTVIWYTALFSTLSFLQNAMRVEETAAQLLVGSAALAGMVWPVVFGALSDRIGRARPILYGYGAALLLLFPLFWMIGAAANPGLAAAARSSPVVVSGPACAYDPFAAIQSGDCARVLDHLSRKGVAYRTERADALRVTIGGRAVADMSPVGLDGALAAAGWNLARGVPAAGNLAIIVVGLVALSALSGATYGPLAALLAEMFPPRIRYSSMSIPYHIGTGYFGGFLPFVSQLIVARTGDPYAGLWYTWAIVLAALATCLWGLRTAAAREGAARN